ncbi:purine-nucleoside phosphorylase [[Mycoplasma] collis]|uniref:purine-nucleoside phosphorylase n=1 Tax=[Mycoplasma] collis TaxID=2127 RepID=UPI00051B2E28|nr:purine-nucleoside phosphorylase [[Mycoplasma] collis]
MTPHINAEFNDIAKTVLLAGDPLRAEYIANTYLTDVKLVSKVRNAYFFTGMYKGRRVTVGTSGMGIASMGIYSYELYKFYNVDKIIRIGSAGSYKDELKIYDLVLADSSFSDSHVYAQLVLGEKTHVLYPSESLNAQIMESALKLGIHINVGRIHSSDVFYSGRRLEKTLEYTQAVAVEMESYALFANAKKFKKHAACLLTISDNLINGELTTPEEREKRFNWMMEVALETV